MPSSMATVVIQMRVFHVDSQERAKLDLMAMFRHLLSNRTYRTLADRDLAPPHPSFGWDFVDTPHGGTRIKRVLLTAVEGPPHA